MNKTINQYINQLHLDPKREAAVRKLIQSVSQSSGGSNEGNSGGSNTPEPEFVDLGLPSGTLWCSCNLGANSPEEPGHMYMWGDHTPYFIDDSDFENSGNLNLIDKEGKVLDYSNWIHYYKHIIVGDESNNYEDVLIKYNHLDYRTELIPIDDTAYQYNKEWRVPTPEEIQELLSNTVQEIVKEERGVTIFKFISTINGNYIYITYVPFISDKIIMSNALTDNWGNYEAYKVILAAAVTYSGNIQLTDHISYGTFFRYTPSPIRPVKHGNVNKNYITIDLSVIMDVYGGNTEYAFTRYSKLMNSLISKRPVYDIHTNSFLLNITKDNDDVITAYVSNNYATSTENYNLQIYMIKAYPNGKLECLNNLGQE